MRYLEVRRHAKRDRPSEHLSQRGVNRARRTGKAMGPFARVIASALPRAFETAVAMGFAVDEVFPALNPRDVGLDAGNAGFAEYADAVRRGGGTARVANEQASLWRSIAGSLADGETALVITHAAVVEAGAVACLPDADHRAWGPACRLCEGVRLAFDGATFVDAEILRRRRRKK